MIYKVVRFSVAVLIAISVTTFAFAGQDDATKADDQKRSDQKKDKNKPKNSDVDNIGTRDINKGNILPTMSLAKETALGQQLAAEVERQTKLFKDPVVNEYVNRVDVRQGPLISQLSQSEFLRCVRFQRLRTFVDKARTYNNGGMQLLFPVSD